MKRASLTAVALAALAITASSVPAAAGPPPGRRPDLVIASFGLTSWGTCAPGKTLFSFQVTVKNTGTGTITNQPLTVWVHDLKTPPAQDWGTGQNEMVTLAPGQTHTYSVGIGYYANNPNFMVSGAPHPFQAVVNPKHVVDESNFNNNLSPGPATYQGQKVINVGPPKGCPATLSVQHNMPHH